MEWLKLIRWKNLSIIFVTQFLAWYCVIAPMHPVAISLFIFFLLSLSTLLIAASGYVINDYFDIKIDSINRPEKVVLGKTIASKNAIMGHSFLNAVALMLAIYIALLEKSPFLPMLQLVSTILLWYYSTKFKRRYIIGNVVVSLLTALTIMALLLYEPILRNNLIKILTNEVGIQFKEAFPLWVLIIYSYFAFMLTWMREIVKDMEDFIGDAAEGCRTMPIVSGLKFSARFTLVLTGLVILPLVYGTWKLYEKNLIVLFLYTLICLILPLIVWGGMLYQSQKTKEFEKLSRFLKIIMVLGVFSLIVYKLQLR